MNATTVDVRSLFQWEDPEVIRLVEGVFGKCILGKVHPPEGELKHQWIAPGGGYYGQWIWDTMFADKTIANALKNGVNERYNALTGKGLGVDFLGMSGTIVTMMLDALGRNHQLQLRASPTPSEMPRQ